MDARLAILKRLDAICREQELYDFGDIQWSDRQLLRSCVLHIERGNAAGWRTFLEHLRASPDVAWRIRCIFQELGWAEYSVEDDRLVLTLPTTHTPALSDSAAKELRSLLDPYVKRECADAMPRKPKRSTVMYVEEKPGMAGHARIGRVEFSASGKTLYYADRKLQSLKGNGYKANYFDVETGLQYWVSNCRKDGNDTLYPSIVEIDEDAREEYWTTIRNQPESTHVTRFRSEGKFSKRRRS